MSNKNLPFKLITAFALIVISLPVTGLAQGAFLKNTQALDDDPRGYCIDVPGPPANIRLDAPLQVHTCKYGEANEDQHFEWAAPDKMHMPRYDVCLTAEDVREDAQLFVQSCTNAAEQSWVLTPAGLLSPTSRPDLCVTLADERRPAGSPSWISPVYHARGVSLTRCESSAQARQQLRWGPITEQPIRNAKQVGDEMPPELVAAIRQVTEQGNGASGTRPLYEDQPRVYELDEIEVTRNLSYGSHERQHLDIHTDRLRRSDQPMPVIMYFHGGGFIRGDKDGSRNVADYFASLGLVGVNATYRLAPEAKFPDGANDMGAAVAWVQENIAEYGGDPSRVFVIGKSAAAAHAATYAFRPNILEPGMPTPAGIIMVSGTYGADTTNPSEGRLAYFGEDFRRWPQFSTLGNIERVNIPVMFTISELDSARTQASLATIVSEVTQKHGQLPRVVQLVGHNHYSPNPSIGTRDTQLSAAILHFVHSIAESQQRMSAR